MMKVIVNRYRLAHLKRVGLGAQAELDSERLLEFSAVLLSLDSAKTLRMFALTEVPEIRRRGQAQRSGNHGQNLLKIGELHLKQAEQSEMLSLDYFPAQGVALVTLHSQQLVIDSSLQVQSIDMMQ